jgi:hypothetical protein
MRPETAGYVNWLGDAETFHHAVPHDAPKAGYRGGHQRVTVGNGVKLRRNVSLKARIDLLEDGYPAWKLSNRLAASGESSRLSVDTPITEALVASTPCSALGVTATIVLSPRMAKGAAESNAPVRSSAMMANRVMPRPA